MRFWFDSFALVEAPWQWEGSLLSGLRMLHEKETASVHCTPLCRAFQTLPRCGPPLRTGSSLGFCCPHPLALHLPLANHTRAAAVDVPGEKVVSLLRSSCA